MTYLDRVFPFVQSVSFLGGYYINISSPPAPVPCISLNIRVIGKSHRSTLVQRHERGQRPRADTCREDSKSLDLPRL